MGKKGYVLMKMFVIQYIYEITYGNVEYFIVEIQQGNRRRTVMEIKKHMSL